MTLVTYSAHVKKYPNAFLLFQQLKNSCKIYVKEIMSKEPNSQTCINKSREELTTDFVW